MLVRTLFQNTEWVSSPLCSGAVGGSRCAQNEGGNPSHRSPFHTVLPPLVSLPVLCPLSSSSSVLFSCRRTLANADPPARASCSFLPAGPLSDLSSGKTEPTSRPAPAAPAHCSCLSSPSGFPFPFAWESVSNVFFFLLLWAPSGQESVWFCSLLLVSRAWQVICSQ